MHESNWNGQILNNFVFRNLEGEEIQTQAASGDDETDTGGNDDEAGDNDEDQSDVEIGDAEDDSSSSSRVDDGDISIVF